MRANKKTFTKVEQQKNKTTKQKQNKERERDERDWIREEMREYRPHSKTLFV